MTVVWPVEHVCHPSMNPRKAGFCDCGKPTLIAQPPVARVLDLEREFTVEAARGAVDPAALIQHAETRSLDLASEYVSNPLTIEPGKDRVREAREELADCRNHLVFHMQEHGSDDNHDLLIALRFVCLAYDRLRPSP